MRLVYDTYEDRIKEDLEKQKEIIDINIADISSTRLNPIRECFETEINIKHTDKITPVEIIKIIESKRQYPDMLEFDKQTCSNLKELEYLRKDMCCEYCYKSLVMHLFENENVEAVTSNFKFYEPAFNVKFNIKYKEEYSEDELIEYIKKEFK